MCDQVTLISEYSQGLNRMVQCLPSGGFDPSKHQSKMDCAKQELSEEAAKDSLLFCSNIVLVS